MWCGSGWANSASTLSAAPNFVQQTKANLLVMSRVQMKL
jgi:hypothetical protein